MASSVITPPVATSRWRGNRTLQRFLRHRLACASLLLIILMALACAFGPALLPFDDLHIDLRARFAPPLTGWHWLGTDPLGRDLLARLLMAGRISLLVGFFAMLLSIMLGTLVGIVAGYYGGRVGALLMRVVDAFLAFPSVFLLLALAAFIKPDPAMITVIIAVTSWMEVARIVEAEVRSLREREYILAARMLGLSGRWIMFRELLPNVVGPIIVAATLTVARAILLEAYISFLGYGIQPPLPSWGNMLNGAQQYLIRAPWLALVPGIAITLAVTCFNFIGDGLRDALDARSEKE
ncbi:ABC transporter permease [Erwiniaceae bacterium L1_54_6]|jgi:peptide/nickel transport system permease protein|uniref:ABC transporter permease n=1 Tax=Pantoea cypripedii TaxID=55209 RepID=A0A1X1EVU6_PANCY|nr:MULTISPECIES: ABC transporter permease [Pantoea]MBP2198174.1 peptide/nickel transport system permease protein [Pantoea cypripedii]MDF7658662.1 ABC transporter permease [Erwiniaceae bacterium L1_54_6]ORM94013.1 peptide ABC transporter permease [Pantoea cypripedii]QGY29631.1 ABC transporter permease [Pantoea cypripedii]